MHLMLHICTWHVHGALLAEEGKVCREQRLLGDEGGDEGGPGERVDKVEQPRAFRREGHRVAQPHSTDAAWMVVRLLLRKRADGSTSMCMGTVCTCMCASACPLLAMFASTVRGTCLHHTWRSIWSSSQQS